MASSLVSVPIQHRCAFSSDPQCFLIKLVAPQCVLLLQLFLAFFVASCELLQIWSLWIQLLLRPSKVGLVVVWLSSGYLLAWLAFLFFSSQATAPPCGQTAPLLGVPPLWKLTQVQSPWDRQYCRVQAVIMSLRHKESWSQPSAPERCPHLSSRGSLYMRSYSPGESAPGPFKLHRDSQLILCCTFSRSSSGCSADAVWGGH